MAKHGYHETAKEERAEEKAGVHKGFHVTVHENKKGLHKGGKHGRSKHKGAK